MLNRLITILGISACLSISVHASTVVWSAEINFNEFEGLPGGFENEGPGVVLMRNRAPGPPIARAYDVLAPGAPRNSLPTWTEGQDGTTDLVIRTQVWDRNGGRWNNLEAEKRRDAYRADTQVFGSTSRSGDSGLVAYEICFENGLAVNADQFAVRVASANGHGELYEWTFITLGGIEDAPFTPEQIAGFRATDYNDLSGSTFFNPNGTVAAGGVARDAFLPRGKTMSQYLTGASQPTSDGFVSPGWFALDDFNTFVKDGHEDAFESPNAGAGRVNEMTVTGTHLGLPAEQVVTKFTVWFGYHDIGFDTNGDGFTATNSNQEASLRTLYLGYGLANPIPEPTTASLGLLAAMMLLRRRRR